MRSKKGAELSVNTIIIIILALIALIVFLIIFSSSMRQIVADIAVKIRSAFGLWNATSLKP